MPICERCQIDRKWLHRHHLKPKSEGGTDGDENILRVCANCHEDIHGGPCGGQGRGRTSNTPAARAKKARSMRRVWEDEDYRERQRKARAASYADPEVRRRKVAGIARWWDTATEEQKSERNRRISESRRGRKFPRDSAGTAVRANENRRLPDPNNIPISEDDLRRLYQDGGLSTRAIATRLQVSQATVSNWLASYEIPVRRMGRPNVQSA